MYYKMLLEVNKKKYQVNDDEFTRKNIPEFCNLRILNDVGVFERLISLFFELKNCSIINMVCFNATHGGFLPIECSAFFDNITLINTDPLHGDNLNVNVASHKVKHINFVDYNLVPKCENYNNSLVFSSDANNICDAFLNDYRNTNNIFVTNRVLNGFEHAFQLKNTEFYIHLNESNISEFKETFKYFFEPQQVLNYDNLLHLCIMVKNGGQQFEDVLTKNLPFIDRWTILDTGSTDNTVEIINKVLVGKKKGELFQEPFINFRDSRNRCLDLAGTECKYILMLDDTYVVEGDLRGFLNSVRGDQLADSFSIIIKSDDVEYGSNRLTKSQSGLRYKYKIHEVIDDKNNVNIIIPKTSAALIDGRFDYMEERTMKRKELDLKLLYEEMEENPSEPRTYYYLAQTYNLLEKYDLAYEFFLKRGTYTNNGFIQERIDAVFEAARLANFKLNKPWEECMKLYEQAFKIDESRPESLYFIGIHYHLNGDNKTAYQYFKRAFDIGFPVHCQYSLKPTLSFHFLPKFLCRLCYEMKDYQLGESAAELFLKNNEPGEDSFQEMISWYNIYKKLNLCPPRMGPVLPNKPIFCFIADGGFSEWSGKNILTSGVGGSETYIIEMARYIQLSGEYNVVVFCNCEKEEAFEGVEYRPLAQVFHYIYTNYIHTCIVSRFSEYLPAVFNGWTESVYLVVHDLTPSGIVIPIDKKLKNVFCLTEWHVEYMNQVFPQLADLTVPFYYGIDFSKFKIDSKKIPYKFIYSSYPNRGLLQLLQMWPQIYEKQPCATLYIYSDVNGKWVNDVDPEQLKQIKGLLADYEKRENSLGIHYCGWVDKKTLADSWASADIWFYPCTFMETFCLTALEAALTKTLVITNDLAALKNTVGDRGVVINGDATEKEWQNIALEKVFEYMDTLTNGKKSELVERNYEWASRMSWENQAKNLLMQYILPNNKLEYKQIYNWTNEFPSKEEKDRFLDVLEKFSKFYAAKLDRPVKVLELGTYTGISLINIVKLIPNSIGFGIDKFGEALEPEVSFYKNVAAENLSTRITGIKGDPKDILFKMIKNGDAYDFIHIDGNRSANDRYVEIFLSWRLLNKNGVMAVNNYFYERQDKLDSYYEAVNQFLEENKTVYAILHMGNTLFMVKTV